MESGVKCRCYCPAAEAALPAAEARSAEAGGLFPISYFATAGGKSPAAIGALLVTPVHQRGLTFCFLVLVTYNLYHEYSVFTI